jgi:hypothetical protein
MKKEVILLGFIFLIIFITACDKIDVSKLSDEDLERINDKTIVCNKPYIRIGTECCSDRDSNAICDRNEIIQTQLSETEVVEAYFNNLVVKSIDENIAATKDSLIYFTGWEEKFYNEQLRYLIEWKRIFNEFYNDYGIKCKEFATIENCEHLQKKYLDDLNYAHEFNVNIIKIELKEDGKIVYTEREEIYHGLKLAFTINFLIKEKDAVWKIYDRITNEGSKRSEITIKEMKLTNTRELKKIRGIYELAIKTIPENIEKQAIEAKLNIKKDTI